MLLRGNRWTIFALIFDFFRILKSNLPIATEAARVTAGDQIIGGEMDLDLAVGVDALLQLNKS